MNQIVAFADTTGRTHHLALELGASEALAARDFDKAFALADRRCRILPAPETHAYVLRAEANWNLGDRRAARADLTHALDVSPDDVAANRRMVAWGGKEQQARAAATVLTADADPVFLRKAMTLLRKRGRHSFASLTILDDAVRGWAAWAAGDRVELAIEDEHGKTSVLLDADPFHPLAGRKTCASAFRMVRPRSALPQTVYVSDADGVFLSTHARPNEAPARISGVGFVAETSDAVAVIVPVYADYPATKRCLDILVAELAANPLHRAIVINDAAPDPRMAPYLARIGTHPSVTVLTNARNLGFVASVNRGIEMASGSNVLLLNADTLPPHGFIDRLARTAATSPDIGMVVPFSNNAEFTSFPIPNVANQLSDVDEATRLDASAARENRGRAFDIPAGTGFCLYVTRACLAAVGGLLDTFHRGYLEDIDFCLRARDHGFRTVCDASIYVGHVGSRSFGAEKSALVLRNFRILERRFPGYPAECAAWTAADPLRAARASIETAAIQNASPVRLLISGSGAMRVIAEERARNLAAMGEAVILAEPLTGGDRPCLSLRRADGAMPQSMTIKLADGRTFRDALDDLGVTAIEMVDPECLPDAGLEVISNTGIPVDLFVAGGSLPGRLADKRWHAAADRATRILAPCPEAFAFAAAKLGPEGAAKLALTAQPSSRRRPANIRRGTKLGIVPATRSMREFRLISAVAWRFGAEAVVLGATIDDERLMADTGAFVTGTINAGDLALLCRRHTIGALFTGLGRPLFGHPLVDAALSSALPVATIDWSAGQCTSRAGDVFIDRAAPDAEVTKALADWMGAP